MRNSANLAFVILLFSVLGCVCSNPPENRNQSNKSQTNSSNDTDEQTSKKCDLKIDQSPEVKGFRLGMTAQDIQKKVPQFKEKKPDEFGFSESFLISDRPSVEVPDGISVKNLDCLMIKLEFYKGKTISVSSYVLPFVAGITLEEYEARVPDSLKIPYKLETDPHSRNYLSLNCDGFKVKAGMENIRYEANWLPNSYWFYSIEDSAVVSTLEKQREQSTADKKQKEKQKRENEANSYKP